MLRRLILNQRTLREVRISLTVLYEFLNLPEPLRGKFSDNAIGNSIHALLVQQFVYQGVGCSSIDDLVTLG